MFFEECLGFRAHPKHLGADPSDNLSSHISGERSVCRNGDGNLRSFHGAALTCPIRPEVNPHEVHRRRADEARDEQVSRLVIEVLRRIDLLRLLSFAVRTGFSTAIRSPMVSPYNASTIATSTMLSSHQQLDV